MNYAALKTELAADPLGRGYAGMTDAEAAGSLNARNRTRVRASMRASEVFQAIDDGEFAALTDAQRSLILGILGFGDINPAGREADVFMRVFGAGSATIASLAVARQETITRADELGLLDGDHPAILPGDVFQARNQTP